MSAALAKEVAGLAEKMRALAARDGENVARAVCYAMPPGAAPVGFNHLAVWPGRLEDFQPGERGSDLRIAAAYLLLEIERLEKPADAAAA